MLSAINIGVSGLNAASTRLNVSANNVANQFSTKTDNNGQITNQPYAPQQVDTVTLSTGGVLALTKPVNPPTVTVTDLSSPTGTSQLPNVDSAQEIVGQITTAEYYKANLKTIQVANETLKSLLDIKT